MFHSFYRCWSLTTCVFLFSIQGGREWSEYYKETNIQKQRKFWDRYLKEIPNEVDTWPMVELDIRRSAKDSVRRAERDFPPASTLTKYRLSGGGKLIESTSITSTDHQGPDAMARYVSFQSHLPESVATFDYVFDKETEITGYAAVKLYIQCINYPDVDLFVALQKIDLDGKEVKFFNSTQQIEASASFGWLRASHRELDASASVPERPVHTHQNRQWLRPCDIVEVQIELWPSSTIWEAGTTLRLAVKGSPFTNNSNVTQFKSPSHGFGEVRVWFGEEYDGSLLVPIV
jgi:predicted acyl esterase